MAGTVSRGPDAPGATAYIAGLIGPGDRKTIQPLAARTEDVGYHQLHHFSASGTWDAAPFENRLLAEADRLVGDGKGYLVIDDTALPRKERASVGVAVAARNDDRLELQ